MSSIPKQESHVYVVVFVVACSGLFALIGLKLVSVVCYKYIVYVVCWIILDDVMK